MKLIFIFFIIIFILILFSYIIFFKIVPYIHKKFIEKIITTDSKNNDIYMKMELGSVYKKTINIKVPLFFNRTYNIEATFTNLNEQVIPNTYDIEGKLLLNIIVTEQGKVISTSKFKNNYWKIEKLASPNSPGNIIITLDKELIKETELNLEFTTINATINNPIEYTKNYVHISGKYSNFFTFDDIVQKV